jgi:Multiubiquitin
MENVVTGGEGRDDKAKGHGPRRPGADGLFFTEVNGAVVKFSEPTPRGERVLDKAACRPAGDFVLIQLLRHSCRSVGLDETVDLAMEGTEVFRAFKSDRIFRFTLNGHGFEWGVAKLPEPELRAVAHVPDDEVIVLEREGHDVDLTPEDVLDLGAAGTEHLRTERKLVTVYFEREPRELSRGVYITEELKRRFGVKEGYILEVINEEGILTPLKPGEKIRLKNGMQFFEQVPCGGSS